MKFKTPAEIDAHFQGQLEAAPDDTARYRIVGEREAAKSTFYEERDLQRDLESARTQATLKYPKAPVDMISGSTPEEIAASAEKLQKFAEDQQAAAISESKERLEREARGRAYGGGGGGGGAPPVGAGGSANNDSPSMELVDRVQGVLRKGTGVIQEHEAGEFASVVGHALFRNVIDGALPEDWEGTRHVPSAEGGSRE